MRLQALCSLREVRTDFSCWHSLALPAPCVPLCRLSLGGVRTSSSGTASSFRPNYLYAYRPLIWSYVRPVRIVTVYVFMGKKSEKKEDAGGIRTLTFAWLLHLTFCTQANITSKTKPPPATALVRIAGWRTTAGYWPDAAARRFSHARWTHASPTTLTTSASFIIIRLPIVFLCLTKQAC